MQANQPQTATILRVELARTPLTGTAQDDLLVAHDAADAMLIDGGDGHDRIFGGAGDDHVTGGNGDDFIVGNPGDDLLSGGSGDDSIMGNDGADRVFGGGGDDTLSGDGGHDLMYGGAGGDFIEGDADNDVLFGDAGADWLYGGAGEDVLVGGTGDDVLNGGTGNDVFLFSKGAGSDVIEASTTSVVQGRCERNEVRFVDVLSDELGAVSWRMNTHGRRDLVIHYGATDRLILQGEEDSDYLPVQRFRFSDGRRMSLSSLLTMYGVDDGDPGAVTQLPQPAGITTRPGPGASPEPALSDGEAPAESRIVDVVASVLSGHQSHQTLSDRMYGTGASSLF